MTGILPWTRRGLMIALLAGCAGLPPGAPRRSSRRRSRSGSSSACRPAASAISPPIIAQRLSETGHPAIVENRLGGNGIIATDAVAKARADGYTP